MQIRIKFIRVYNQLTNNKCINEFLIEKKKLDLLESEMYNHGKSNRLSD